MMMMMMMRWREKFEKFAKTPPKIGLYLNSPDFQKLLASGRYYRCYYYGVLIKIVCLVFHSTAAPSPRLVNVVTALLSSIVRVD
jgi:hypothetical protein